MKKEDIDITVFKHRTAIQVRYIDIDMQKHVNNATILSYVEQGRVEYLNMLFPDNDFNKNGLIIARTEIDYFEPIFLYEKIFCYTRVEHIGNKSFNFENVVVSNDNAIKCYVKSVMVCFDYESNATIPVPQSWQEKISDFEQVSFNSLN